MFPGRSKFALIGASAALVAVSVAPAAGAAAAPAAGAEPAPTLKGLVLSGGCLGQPDLKNVIVSPKVNSLWVPLRFTAITDSATFTPLKKWILPAKVSVTSATEDDEGLKSRHIAAGTSYSRPGRIPSLRPVTCEFVGAVKPAGEFTVTMTGTIVGGGTRSDS